MGQSHKHYAELKARHKRAHTMWFRLYKVPELAQVRFGMEIRTVSRTFWGDRIGVWATWVCVFVKIVCTVYLRSIRRKLLRMRCKAGGSRSSQKAPSKKALCVRYPHLPWRTLLTVKLMDIEYLLLRFTSCRNLCLHQKNTECTEE